MKPSIVIQIGAVMLLWAICFPLITAGFEYAPHLTFASLRAVLSGLVLVGIATALRQPLPTSWRIWKMITIIGIGATSFGFLGMFHAAEFVSPGIATVIANTQPLMAAFLAALVLQEKLSWQRLAGLLLGFGGIVFIALPEYFAGQNDSYAIGVAYIFLAASGITVSNVWIRKVAGEVDALMSMGLQLLVGSIPLALIAWTYEDPMQTTWSIEFISILVILSVLGTALVYWLWFSILERVSLNRANAFSFFIPIFGLTMGVTFFGETLSIYQGIGIVLTIIGVGLAFQNQDKRNQAS